MLLRSSVGFLIRCILDYSKCHLVDFWEKLPTDLDFIWIEQNSYNSGILFHIVSSCTSIFKLKSSLVSPCFLFKPIITFVIQLWSSMSLNSSFHNIKIVISFDTFWKNIEVSSRSKHTGLDLQITGLIEASVRRDSA